MDGRSVTQSMNVYKGRLLKKIFKSKIEARPVNAGYYIKTLLTLELSHFRKSASMLFSSELVAASSDCS